MDRNELLTHFTEAYTDSLNSNIAKILNTNEDDTWLWLTDIRVHIRSCLNGNYVPGDGPVGYTGEMLKKVLNLFTQEELLNLGFCVHQHQGRELYLVPFWLLNTIKADFALETIRVDTASGETLKLDYSVSEQDVPLAAGTPCMALAIELSPQPSVEAADAVDLVKYFNIPSADELFEEHVTEVTLDDSLSVEEIRQESLKGLTYYRDKVLGVASRLHFRKEFADDLEYWGEPEEEEDDYEDYEDYDDEDEDNDNAENDWGKQPPHWSHLNETLVFDSEIGMLTERDLCFLDPSVLKEFGFLERVHPVYQRQIYLIPLWITPFIDDDMKIYHESDTGSGSLFKYRDNCSFNDTTGYGIFLFSE